MFTSDDDDELPTGSSMIDIESSWRSLSGIKVYVEENKSSKSNNESNGLWSECE